MTNHVCMLLKETSRNIMTSFIPLLTFIPNSHFLGIPPNALTCVTSPQLYILVILPKLTFYTKRISKSYILFIFTIYGTAIEFFIEIPQIYLVRCPQRLSQLRTCCIHIQAPGSGLPSLLDTGLLLQRLCCVQE